MWARKEAWINWYGSSNAYTPRTYVSADYNLRLVVPGVGGRKKRQVSNTQDKKDVAN